MMFDPIEKKLHPIRLLIVDDDDAIRDGMLTYLAHCGFTVTGAESAEEALVLFVKEKPDLIISDLYLPNSTGLELLSQIKCYCNETPFVVISGAGGIIEVVQALRLGANDYITKPLDMQLLEHAIRSALKNTKLQKENTHYKKKLKSVIKSLKEKINTLRVDHKAGKKVQQDLLPPSPFIFKQYEVNHCILPSLYLSGDCVDIFKINNNDFGFYLADVSGHGASSAFVTVLLKHMTINWLQKNEFNNEENISHTVLSNDYMPNKLLGYLNEQLFNTDLGKHVTIFCGIIDTINHTLTYSAAGQYPFPVLLNKDNIKLLKMENLPLGLCRHVAYKWAMIDLQLGDSLTIFSDGVLDLFNHNKESKQKRLINEIIKQAGQFHQLLPWLKGHNFYDATDDITLLTLSIK